LSRGRRRGSGAEEEQSLLGKKNGGVFVKNRSASNSSWREYVGLRKKKSEPSQAEPYPETLKK
jgi:hypothetical protein